MRQQYRFDWQSKEKERLRGLCEVHLQMEMTGLLMTGLYGVIVASGGEVSTCHHLVPQSEMVFLLSAFQQSVSVTKDCWESESLLHTQVKIELTQRHGHFSIGNPIKKATHTCPNEVQFTDIYNVLHIYLFFAN